MNLKDKLKAHLLKQADIKGFLSRSKDRLLRGGTAADHKAFDKANRAKDARKHLGDPKSDDWMAKQIRAGLSKNIKEGRKAQAKVYGTALGAGTLAGIPIVAGVKAAGG